MSDWYWQVIALKAAFALACFVCYVRAGDTVQKLPFCNPTSLKDAGANNDLVIVSTLDGKLTAFSTENGIKAWDVETQPLLSSNLHQVELVAGGKWVRLVPSLRGTLYSLSGETIEPLPFNAEQLLSTSYKYSDDLVIAGARETLWLGLDASSGGVLYECGSSGCSNEHQASTARDVLVLRRHSNTVRALEPRTGNEKWNFSVAEHQLALNRQGCTNGNAGPAAPVHIAVALHDGSVALRTPGERQLIWQQKLEAPVAGMWRLHEGALQPIDVLWEATQSLVEGGARPSLYIGMHQRQLYIQESQLYARQLETAVSVKPLPWKLVTARRQLQGDTALVPQPDPVPVLDPNTLSLVALYGNSGPTDENGFFLYLQETCEQAVQVPDEREGEPPNGSGGEPPSPHHVHVHVYSLWFWWKEVLLIAVSSALLMNLMIWPRFFVTKPHPPSPLPTNKEYIVVERHYERPSPPPAPPEYSSRYCSDFTPLRVLGRGGFGVVFEARNNIDHCSYAVKRITLPRRESKRDPVLREVRALAKLEHEHIVRYFNAWVEEPPPSWQKQKDEQLMRELDGASSIDMEFTVTSPQPAADVRLNMKCEHDGLDQCVDAMEYEKMEPSKRLRSLSCSDSFSIVFDENASKNPKLTSDDITPNQKNTKDNDLSMDIVFAHSESDRELSDGLKNSSVNKRLERVEDIYYNNESEQSSKKKKKGHKRHWSLDMVVRTDGQADVQKYLYIQMQLCRRDSLHDWLRQNCTLDARGDKAKTLFSQIVSAVEYVHLAGLIHRDLKPRNILFAADGRVKVGDFGLVTEMSDASQDGPCPSGRSHPRHTNHIGTKLYMSPEQQTGQPYGYKVDIYSLGLVLFELLHPVRTDLERVRTLEALRGGAFPPAFARAHPEETELLKLMLHPEPSRRPTATGVKARAPLYLRTDERYHFTLPALAGG